MKNIDFESRFGSLGKYEYYPTEFFDSFIIEENLQLEDFLSLFQKPVNEAKKTFLEPESRKSFLLETRRINFFYHLLRAIKSHPELLKMKYFQVATLKEKLSKIVFTSHDDFIKRCKELKDRHKAFYGKISEAYDDSGLYLEIAIFLYDTSQKEELLDLVLDKFLRFWNYEIRSLALEFLFGIDFKENILPYFDLGILIKQLPSIKQINEYQDIFNSSLEPFPSYISKIILNLGNHVHRSQLKDWLKKGAKRLKGETWYWFLNCFA